MLTIPRNRFHSIPTLHSCCLEKCVVIVASKVSMFTELTLQKVNAFLLSVGMEENPITYALLQYGGNQATMYNSEEVCAVSFLNFKF
jgi:hypothetical protein